MTVRRVLGIGLDPYTVDLDTEFFRGKPLNADVTAGEIKAEEVRIRAMGHDFEVLLIDARGGAAAECGCPRRAGSAAGGRGGDRRRRPPRSGTDAGAGGAGERGDRGGAWGADRVQHFADRHGGSDYASVVITRVLLDLDAFFLEHRLCGDLDGGASDERAWLVCGSPSSTRGTAGTRRSTRPGRPRRRRRGERCSGRPGRH